MNMKRILILLGAVMTFGGQAALGQSAGQSGYVFRFNSGLSELMGQDMTFQSESPLDLGQCTTVEKFNGPISCAVNCSGDTVCLMVFQGPTNLETNDIVEKLGEQPMTGASGAVSSRARMYLGE